MRMHQIAVDQDIFEFLQERAEPLVDTPNSVLRRLLLNNEIKENTFQRESRTAVTLPDLPSVLPEALRQILGVIYLVRAEGYTRVEATRVVAKHHGIFRETVSDKYGRQLGLTASKVDQLLEEDGLEAFSEILRRRFPEHRHIIVEFLANLQEVSGT